MQLTKLGFSWWWFIWPFLLLIFECQDVSPVQSNPLLTHLCSLMGIEVTASYPEGLEFFTLVLVFLQHYALAPKDDNIYTRWRLTQIAMVTWMTLSQEYLNLTITILFEDER